MLLNVSTYISISQSLGKEIPFSMQENSVFLRRKRCFRSGEQILETRETAPADLGSAASLGYVCSTRLSLLNQHNKMNAPKKIVIATHIILVIVEV